MNAPEPRELVDVGELDRRTYIGSSDAAAIIGIGAYGNTPVSVYLKKIGEAPDELDAGRLKFLERRKRWEPVIVEMLREEFDCEVVATNRRYRDAEHEFIAGELDFEWVDPETAEIQNGEIKTVSPFAFGDRHGWGEAGTDEIPVHYAAQAMHNLGITRRAQCVVAAMIGLDRMIFYRIHRDDETIAAMRERCVRFWHDHVLARVPPEAVSYEDCLRLVARMKGRPLAIDEDIKAALENVRLIRSSQAALKQDEAEAQFALANKILGRMKIPHPYESGDANKILLTEGGKQVATWNLQITRRLDTDLIKAKAPEIYLKYGKNSSSRVLRFSKINH